MSKIVSFYVGRKYEYISGRRFVYSAVILCNKFDVKEQL
jgi:hypothetical protein